jgi:hypothetical protein
MKQIKLLLFVIACTNIFAACKKDKTEPTELSKLPAATKTGANTFGCLVNGKAWVAQRNDCSIFCSPSLKILYDAAYGGTISITALKIDISNNIDEQFNIFFDSSNFKTIHPITLFNTLTTASFRNYATTNSCSNYLRYLDSTVNYSGKVILTKYDLQNGIFSGIFDFTLSKPGCEIISVTEGRFDKKL